MEIVMDNEQEQITPDDTIWSDLEDFEIGVERAVAILAATRAAHSGIARATARPHVVMATASHTG